MWLDKPAAESLVHSSKVSSAGAQGVSAAQHIVVVQTQLATEHRTASVAPGGGKHNNRLKGREKQTGRAHSPLMVVGISLGKQNQFNVI